MLIQFQFYCKIGMTERSQWTEYKINNQIYKQRTAEHNRLLLLYKLIGYINEPQLKRYCHCHGRF